MICHGILREILNRYLDVGPANIQFKTGPHGKPYLSDDFNDSGIKFNMSDSRDLAMIALAHGREIGVDLEYIRPLPDAEQIAKRYFSSLESGILLSLPAGQRQKAFFNCWTRKEAYLKALGDGLARPLDQFDVTLAPGEPARLIEIRYDTQESVKWKLESFEPSPSTVAALAVEGHGWDMSCWNWVEDKAFLSKERKRKGDLE